MLENMLLSKDWHHNLYLGEPGHLKKFADPRINEYWTYEKLPEISYVNALEASEEGVIYHHHETLWVLANNFCADTYEVAFYADTYKDQLGLLPAYQYVNYNGDGSIFQGYAWR
ncbi:hypothetical protein MNEG_10387 [Monoraphidium neglectum]|uniref:Uncharacterized protein n=1 Tax=Monoraphidium neglectum TaxID=145388 RepID=A0A0D2M1Q9_9CHLO|nr:hypothetical protein MNEG_10387 [Monoraphidium neglectum]KIY97574.1 hypothetical protein MNEG_10387 [Monoraphidium neglectum]|eukprot:XP_013896594.1 hypothetical protein MNEG_10387 [Monoraphidium neglectum]